MLKPGKSKLTADKNRVGYVFILPCIIGLVIFFLPSVVQSLIYSFEDITIKFNDIVREPNGIENYKEALQTDITYRSSLINAVRGMVVDTLIIMVFSFFVSTLLNQKFRGRGFARMIFFLPVILSSGIISSVDAGNALTEAYNSSNTIGSVASAFESGGLASFFNLEELLVDMNVGGGLTEILMYAIDNTYRIISDSGVQILIFLSALQAIPRSLFEASQIDGATKWEQFWKITFPIIMPTILVNIVYTVVCSFTNPAYGLSKYIQDAAFGSNRMGYSAALSWIYMLLVGIILGTVWVIISKRSRYLEG